MGKQDPTMDLILEDKIMVHHLAEINILMEGNILPEDSIQLEELNIQAVEDKQHRLAEEENNHLQDHHPAVT